MATQPNFAPQAFRSQLNQTLTESNLKFAGNALKGVGAAIVLTGLFGGFPAIMPLGSAIGAVGTGLGLGAAPIANAVTPPTPSLALVR